MHGGLNLSLLWAKGFTECKKSLAAPTFDKDKREPKRQGASEELEWDTLAANVLRNQRRKGGGGSGGTCKSSENM